MEPLVIFGAGLVIWCGCLSVADAVRELKALRQAGPVRRKAAEKESALWRRAPACRTAFIA